MLKCVKFLNKSEANIKNGEDMTNEEQIQKDKIKIEIKEFLANLKNSQNYLISQIEYERYKAETLPQLKELSKKVYDAYKNQQNLL